MHLKFSVSEKWVLDQTSIFAQVDAFVQRCKDLVEVKPLQIILFSNNYQKCWQDLKFNLLVQCGKEMYN